MKASFCAVLLLAVSAVPALADPPKEDVLRPRVLGPANFYFQLDVGLNLNLLDGNPYLRPLMSYEQETSLYNDAFGISPLVGLTVGYDFSPHFSLALRADYDPRYASRSETVNDTCETRDALTGNTIRNPMPVAKDYEVDATYLSISLLPAYRFENLFIFAGPTFSVPFSRTIRETNTITDDGPCYYLAPGPDTTRSITGSLGGSDNMNTRISLKVGVGYVLPLTSSLELVPQLGLDFAMNGLLGEDEDLVLSNAARPGSAGISVPINRQTIINSMQATIGLRLHL